MKNYLCLNKNNQKRTAKIAN